MVSPYIKNEGSVFRPASGHNKHKLYWSLQTNYLKLSTICAYNFTTVVCKYSSCSNKVSSK